MAAGIYAIWNVRNGKRYIGRSVGISRRWREHRCWLRNNRHHCKHLQGAWNKYGEGAFVFRVLLHCDRNALRMYEQHVLDIWRPKLYNKSMDADGGAYAVSQETRRKQSLAKLGRPNGRKGQRLSEDHRRALCVPKRHRNVSHPSAFRKGFVPWNKGRICPEISAGQMGRRATADTLKRLSESHKGIRQSDATKAKRLATWARWRAARTV